MSKVNILKIIEKNNQEFTKEYLRLDKIIKPLVNYFNSIELYTYGSCGSHLNSDTDIIITSRGYVSFYVVQENYDNYVLFKQKINQFIKDYQNEFCQNNNKYISPDMLLNANFSCDYERYTLKDFHNFTAHNFIYRKWNYVKVDNEFYKLYWEKELDENSCWKMVDKEKIDNNNLIQDCFNINFGLDEPYERRYHFYKKLYDFLGINYNEEDMIIEHERNLRKNNIAIRNKTF